MRLIYMGSPAEVIAPLNHLIRSRADLVAVVSQPARPKGRGKVLSDPPVAEFAKVQGLRVLQPEKASDPDFLNALRELRPDVIITAAYGQILTDAFLAIPTRATINIHPSLLPRYRGATPVAASLLAGDTTTGITILFTIKKLDAGNIILQKEVATPPLITAGDFTKDLFLQSGPLLLAALEKLRDPNFIGEAQDENQVSFCRKIAKDDGRIHWSEDAVTLLRKYQGLNPWPGIASSFKGEGVQFFEVCLAEYQMPEQPGTFQYDKTQKKIMVQTLSGQIAVAMLRRSGGKSIDAGAFWNGIQGKYSEYVFGS